MGHLNNFSASGAGNLNKNFPKIQMPAGLSGGGMFKLRFDWYITVPFRVFKVMSTKQSARNCRKRGKLPVATP